MPESSSMLGHNVGCRDRHDCISTHEAILTLVVYCFCSSTLAVFNKLALQVFPLPSLLSALQFVAAFVFVLVFKWTGHFVADPFGWHKVRAYGIYVFFFCTSIYSSMKAVSHSNLRR